MSQLKKEFLTKEQALRLKDLGFFEPCIGVYRNGEIVITTDPKDHYYYEDSAVTYSQAFRWFRENHGINSYIKHECPDVEPYYEYVIDEDVFDMFDTYEEAEVACIDKLIEIVKEQKDDSKKT